MGGSAMDGGSRVRRGALRVLVAAVSLGVLVAAVARLQQPAPQVGVPRDVAAATPTEGAERAPLDAPGDVMPPDAREAGGARARPPEPVPVIEAPAPESPAPAEESPQLAVVGPAIRQAAAARRAPGSRPRRQPCDARGVGGRLVRSYELRRHVVRVCRARRLYMLVTTRATGRRVVLLARRHGRVTRGTAGAWRYRAGPGGLEIRRRGRVVLRDAPRAGLTARART